MLNKKEVDAINFVPISFYANKEYLNFLGHANYKLAEWDNKKKNDFLGKIANSLGVLDMYFPLCYLPVNHQYLYHDTRIGSVSQDWGLWGMTLTFSR